MSAENVELARRYYEALNAAYKTGEIRAFVETTCDPEIIIQPSGFLPETSEVHGHEETIKFISAQQEAFESLSLEPQEIIDAGDVVVVPVRLGGRARHTGLEMEFSFVQVATVRAGKTARIEVYTEMADALKAAGLE